MKKLAIYLFAVALAFSVAGNAGAYLYEGKITSLSSGGMTAGDGWSDGDFDNDQYEADAVLSWGVDYSAGLWTYDYTFTVDEHAPSHVIIEVSNNFIFDNIKAGTTDYNSSEPYYPLLGNYSNDNSNPNMPDGGIYGIKWDLLPDEPTYSWTIVTDRAPMWGDFYAKDGYDNKETEEWAYAYNTHFGTDLDPLDPSYIVGNGNNGGWVLVPDTQTAPVPEPATFWRGLEGKSWEERKDER